jgi:DNA-binding transcriptional ArsR family regulator
MIPAVAWRLDDYGEVFAALADHNRRAVLEYLASDGERTATSLAGTLAISRQAVVKHLVLLDRAKLVESRRSGRETRYRVRADRLVETGQRLEAIARSWDRSLAMLKHAAESEDEPTSG